MKKDEPPYATKRGAFVVFHFVTLSCVSPSVRVQVAITVMLAPVRHSWYDVSHVRLCEEGEPLFILSLSGNKHLVFYYCWLPFV